MGKDLKGKEIGDGIVQTKGGTYCGGYSDRTTKFNTPLNAQIYSDAIKKIVTELNLILDDMEQIEMCSGHTFRHTFATRCIESDIKPKTLQSYLGHATLQMTMDLYVHNTEAQKQSEMLKLDDALKKVVITEESIENNFEKCLCVSGAPV